MRISALPSLLLLFPGKGESLAQQFSEQPTFANSIMHSLPKSELTSSTNSRYSLDDGAHRQGINTREWQLSGKKMIHSHFLSKNAQGGSGAILPVRPQ